MMSETIQAEVATYNEVLELVNDHGDLMRDWEPAPWGVDTPELFLYRVGCKDGEVIDFYAVDSETHERIYYETF